MAKKKTKKKGKKKKRKSPAAALSKYKDTFPKMVKFLIIEAGVINKVGDPDWKVIAKLLGVTHGTLLEWRKQSGKHYKEEFAQACQEGVDATELGTVKRGVMHLAKPHLVKEKKLELKMVGPDPPPAGWRKEDYIEWAKKNLAMKVGKKDSIATIRRSIKIECGKRKVEKLVVVGEKRETKIDLGAAKIIVANVGPKKDRWLSKEAVVLEGDTFAEALAKGLKSKDRPK